MLIQLPNGLLDGGDLFNYAEIDEIRGKQQNYLADKGLVVGNIGHIPKILTDLVKILQTKEGVKWQGKIADAIYKLPQGDLETILIKIRENTYGPKYYHQAECSHCKHINKNLKVDLDSLVLSPMGIEELRSSKKITLPKLKKEAELKAIYLKDLFEVIKITSSKHDSLITSMVAVSLKSLGDKSPVTSSDIDNIPASDLQFIQDEILKTKLEGTIDSTLQIDCQECKKEFEAKLNVYDPNFFYPTKDSTI